MIFTVVLTNSVVIEIDVDIGANGQECLDQVCQHLQILEYDYFGLQFSSSKGEKIWLNMRNRINQQVSEMRDHIFHFRVKFYIQPHLLLQESSRHLFYIQVKQEILFKTLHVQDKTKLVTILALIAQEEFGDHVSNRLHLPGYETFLERICPKCDPDFLKSVASCHSRLRGLSSQNAEYRMLQKASTLEDYGMEKHEVKMDSKLMSVGVGPEGMFIYDNHMELVDRINYQMIQRTVHDACSCFMSVYTEEMETRRIEVRLRTLRAASSLYRCITEMHSFYLCDTVNNEVSSQTYRDPKGLLNGQNYVFDVQRTWREAYDSTRRKLMKEAANQSLPPLEKEKMEDNSGTHILPKNHECQDVQVFVRVKPSKRNVHDESTAAASLTEFTKEEINFSKMGMIALNILVDVLYDLLKPEKPHLRPRCDCDITYLYSEHRNLNKHIPSNSWGGQWQRIQTTDIAIGDDIERIRLTRNELQHSRIFHLDDKRFNELRNILSDLLKRFDQHNKPTRLYTDHLNEILVKTISAQEVKSIKNEILGMAIEVEIDHQINVSTQ